PIRNPRNGTGQTRIAKMPAMSEIIANPLLVPEAVTIGCCGVVVDKVPGPCHCSRRIMTASLTSDSSPYRTRADIYDCLIVFRLRREWMNLIQDSNESRNG